MVVEHTYNNNNSSKTARNAIRNHNNHRKKVETFESKYGNLENDLNHLASSQDARSPEHDQPPLSLPFTNSCPYHSTHEPCSNQTEQNIDEDNDDQPINIRDSIERQNVDHPINEKRPILFQSKELIRVHCISIGLKNR